MTIMIKTCQTVRPCQIPTAYIYKLWMARDIEGRNTNREITGDVIKLSKLSTGHLVGNFLDF